MFKTLADVKAANKAAGMHFFDRETLKWWKSRMESGLIRGKYFITSEESFSLTGDPKRIFCARMVRDDASIETIKRHLATRDDAKDAILEHAERS